MSPDPRIDASVKLVSGWLRSESCPCSFPSSIYKKRIAVTTLLKADNITILLEEAFEGAALHHKFALVIFPMVDTAEALAALLADLLREPQWVGREVGGDEEFFSLEMLWKTHRTLCGVPDKTSAAPQTIGHFVKSLFGLDRGTSLCLLNHHRHP